MCIWLHHPGRAVRIPERERERESTASKVRAMETINAKLIKVDKTIYAISKHTRYQ